VSVAGSRRRTALIVAAVVATVMAVALPVVISNQSALNFVILTVMYVALASAWNLGSGYSGYISLGHAAFFGFGAYALAILLKYLVASHIGFGGPYGPFLLAPLTGLLTAAFAVPLGWVAFRTRATAFVIVTIALMFVVQTLALNMREITDGSQGLAFPVPPWGTSFAVPFYYVMVVAAALTILLSAIIRRSNFGLGLLAIRDDEDKARSAGVPAGPYKLAAFVVSAGIFGTIGGIYGYYISFIYPTTAVDPLAAAGVVLMSFLGGAGTVLGPILGALIIEPAQLALAYTVNEAAYLILYGALFLFVVLVMPRGIIPSTKEWLEGRRARRQELPVAAIGKGERPPTVDGEGIAS
jgi:branched-chain amino acid transport system permease protein